MRTAILDLVYVGMGGLIGSSGRYLASATVFRGLEDFGTHSRVPTAKILRLSSDLPLVIEIVDTSEKIEQFMPVIDDAVKEGLATLDKATIRFYRGGK